MAAKTQYTLVAMLLSLLLNPYYAFSEAINEDPGPIDWVADMRIRETRKSLANFLEAAIEKNKDYYPVLPPLNYEEIAPSGSNTTKANQALVINLIPHTIPEHVLAIMANQSAELNFKWVRERPEEDPPKYGRNVIEELVLVNKWYLFETPAWAHALYVYYVNLFAYDVAWLLQPNFVTFAREPIERQVARILASGRGANVSQSDVEDCIRSKDPVCAFHPDQMQACFFAGSCKACGKSVEDVDGNDLMEIAQMAKHHLEYGYSVVGLSHHMESSFLLLESVLPRFFAGSLKRYRKQRNESPDVNEEELSPQVTESVRSLMLRNKMVRLDIDLYHFALRRFNLQLRTVAEAIA